MFGCVHSTALDMTHVDNHGYLFLDDSKYRIAELLLNAGDKLGYTYDLDQCWRHEIVVETVFPEGTSSGACLCLGGSRACPPEDGIGLDAKGNLGYQQSLKWIEGQKNATKRKKYESISRAINVKDIFEPEKFRLVSLF